MKKITLLTLCFSSFTYWITAQFSGGDGTTGNPYQIATLADLETLSTNNAHWDKHFIQTADIDASATVNWDSGAGFSPIGNNNDPFDGSYDGQGHTIDAMVINRNISHVALFGHSWGNVVISNLGMSNINFTGLGASAGLVGLHRGTITNCFSTGEIQCTDYSGGLVGSHSGGTVLNCYSSVTIVGTQRVGGLIGFANGGTITNSYARGSVTGTLYVGGLIGHGVDNITVNCFWDTETSGLANSAGGVGLTTDQMQRQSTYTYATWDFVTETVNGTDDIWKMNCTTNSGYPILYWQELNTAPTISGTTSITNTTCEWANDGAIDLTPTGGTLPYSYEWSTGEISEDLSNIGQGSYTVTIMDDNFCVGILAVDVENNSSVNTETTISGITITATASGMTYQWLDCDDDYALIAGATAQNFTPTANGNYAVIVDNGDCADTSACVAINSLSLDEAWSTELVEVYPNPTTGEVRLVVPGTPTATIEVYNSLGQKTETHLSQTETTQLSLVGKPGIYFIKVITTNFTQIVQVIKH